MTSPLTKSLLTPLGWSVLVVMIISYGVGRWLGWIEFVVISVGCLLALVIAVPFVLGGHSLRLEREIRPERVQAGDTATSVLTVHNTGSTPSAPRIIEDRIAGVRKVVDVPSLGAGARSQAITTLPTTRRGVVQVGPAVVAKGDPLGLLRRDLGRTNAQELWVHPRFVPLLPLKSGFVKDLEGPTFDSSPAGTIAFHAIREYAQGDDIRHIHWMSTARTGSLMVRHYVDNRRPHLGVLIDAAAEHLGEETFEVALEVAASQIVSADLDGRPLAVWVGETEIVTNHRRGGRNDSLDRLCLVAPSPSSPSLVELYDRMRRVDVEMSALVVVTGGRSAEDLLPLASVARRHGGVLIFRLVGSDVDPIAVPGARIHDCADLSQFAAAWSGLAR